MIFLDLKLINEENHESIIDLHPLLLPVAEPAAVNRHSSCLSYHATSPAAAEAHPTP